MESNCLVDDDKALTIEANEVVREIAFAVNYVELSSVLPTGTNLVYINMTTKENRNFCIELSLQGFRVSFVQSYFKIIIIRQQTINITNIHYFNL